MSQAVVEGVGVTEHPSVSEEVVLSVAAAKGVDPLELDPLFDVIDPEALDALYERDADRTGSPRRVEFTYEGHRVAVGEDGSVTVSKPPLEGS